MCDPVIIDICCDESSDESTYSLQDLLNNAPKNTKQSLNEKDDCNNATNMEIYTHKCPLCIFTAKNARGLRIHTTMKHGNYRRYVGMAVVAECLNDEQNEREKIIIRFSTSNTALVANYDNK